MEEKILKLKFLKAVYEHAKEYDYVQKGYGFDEYLGYPPHEIVDEMMVIIDSL